VRIRPIEPADAVNAADLETYPWVDGTGEPVCDLTLTHKPKAAGGDPYETGYREGASSLIADIALRFYDDDDMGELLEFFRVLTGSPELAWPKDDDVWVVIDEDRRDDVQTYPFASEQRAIAYARELAGLDPVGRPEDVTDAEDDDASGEKRLTPEMRAAGWVFFARYSTEGDSVRVVKRQMNAAGR